MSRRFALLVGLLPTLAQAQGTSPLAAERQAYSEWLLASPVSPLAAVAMQRMQGPVTLGPDTADIPLSGLGPATAGERGGAVVFTGQDGKARTLPAGRPVAIPPWTFQVLGDGSALSLLVYGAHRGSPPGWYPPAQGLAYVIPLEPAARAERRRVLTLDGIEVEAELAGYVRVPLGPAGSRLQVMRMPVPGTEERELQVYFRDATNGKGTYPAGRFVELVPTAGGYRLDFNRARNPFCAYSSVYPCPVPWAGNAIAAPVEAGERYRGTGTEP